MRVGPVRRLPPAAIRSRQAPTARPAAIPPGALHGRVVPTRPADAEEVGRDAVRHMVSFLVTAGMQLPGLPYINLSIDGEAADADDHPVLAACHDSYQGSSARKRLPVCKRLEAVA